MLSNTVVNGDLTLTIQSVLHYHLAIKAKETTSNFKIGCHAINIKKSDSHLGTLLSSEKKETVSYMVDRIVQAKTACFVIKYIGSFLVPVTPAIASKLYWNTCVPKICYGAEIMEFDDDVIGQIKGGGDDDSDSGSSGDEC